MSKNIRICFIGAGNVAWHLAPALENAGYPVIEIYSRNIQTARQLATRMYEANFKDELDFSVSNANLFIVAVADDVIPYIVSEAVFPKNATVVHTSGTQPLSILEMEGVNLGVFYPLQTFTKERKLNIKQVPFCLEAQNKDTELLLVNIAQQISQTVYLVSSEERKVLHLSAVFASNFVNHLLVLAKQILDEENLEFDLLKPLIKETIAKALETNEPATMQTGPAIRKDLSTLSNHLFSLQQDQNKYKIYQLLSESIMT